VTGKAPVSGEAGEEAGGFLIPERLIMDS